MFLKLNQPDQRDKIPKQCKGRTNLLWFNWVLNCVAQTISSIGVNCDSYRVSLSPQDLSYIFLFQTSPTADSFYSGGQWYAWKWEGDIIFQTKEVWTACFGNLPDSRWGVGYTARGRTFSRARAELLWWIPKWEKAGKCETTGKASWVFFLSMSLLFLLNKNWAPLDLRAKVYEDVVDSWNAC